MPSFGEWTFTLDRDLTVKAYEQASGGGADTCDCASCRNFRLARSKIFPPPFLTFLDELGVDFRKDGEVYGCGPLDNGLYVYGGWYHFVGRLRDADDFQPVDYGPDFRAWLRPANAPRLATLSQADVVQLEFESRIVPWLLDEPDIG